MTTLGDAIKAEDTFGVVDGSKRFSHDIDAHGTGGLASGGVAGWT